ncbi:MULTISPECIES: alpha/beta hydrolase [unclassified Enterococcus]|uniref:alpha/beta hydrolase n=1 Tax=unclassified Enterococcus TaxID=2608891 RepID=UPI001CE0539A|nr:MULTISPECIES: alpha/beta hydrolase [unclassified Enterococcus]MCA5011507.1 alpha/beta hydrolase [Enterococcus sp. S23]MCA5015051.1 alpha/beta hydrolase [Enterococcus sp. S22(2020)]
MKQERTVKSWMIQFFSMAAIMLLFIFLGQKSLTVFADKSLENNPPIPIQTPTIMVPGTNGTVDRFDGLIKALKVNEQSEVLKVTVATDGTTSFSGKLSPSSEHPIIVIAFEDSSDDTLAVQGKWYQQALTAIQKKYIFKTYNYLGHSNGGLVITSYLENFLLTEDPELNKLITLGTPYNGTSDKENDTVTNAGEVKQVSQLLKSYVQNRHEIPSTIDMLNIAGEIEDSATDGTVPVQSVFSGSMIYQENVSDYQELLIQGERTKHSELVENKEFIKQLQAFFWET